MVAAKANAKAEGTCLLRPTRSVVAIDASAAPAFRQSPNACEQPISSISHI
jgi:hypothetical protein